MRAKKTEEETKNVSEDDKNVAILHEKMRRKRLRRLIGILVVLMIVLTVLNAGESVYFYTQNVKSERARIAEGAAKMTAAVIDPEKIDEYLLKGKEAPGYEQTESALYNIRDNSVGIQYLYVFQVKEDGCHVIFDLDADGDEAYEPGEVVRFEEQDLLTCKETEPIEMEDWIEWVITVYYPVYDQNGNFVCYVGADASLADVRSSMLAFLINVVLGFSVLFGIAAIITVKLSRNYYKISEWEALVEKERKDKQLIREMVMAFAKLVDMKDEYTNGHSFRVAEYTAMLTRELGYDEETVEKYYNIALMHDIGKIGIPQEVLNKADKLTDEEYDIMKSHTTLGYNVLKDISIMPELSIGAGAHHERPDGKGYPRGLKGDEIPMVAQIIAVADTFDAMYSSRPYRKRMDFEKVISIMKEVSGTQLSSDVMDAFLRLVERGEFRDPEDLEV